MTKIKLFHEKLKILMDDFANNVYDVSESFPKKEIFGLTSQLRRAVLSIILNYIEGFARKKSAVMKNSFEISYGSLKETKYLIYFSYRRKYMTETEYKKLIDQAEEIGRMLWSTLEKI